MWLRKPSPRTRTALCLLESNAFLLISRSTVLLETRGSITLEFTGRANALDVSAIRACQFRIARSKDEVESSLQWRTSGGGGSLRNTSKKTGREARCASRGSSRGRSGRLGVHHRDGEQSDEELRPGGKHLLRVNQREKVLWGESEKPRPGGTKFYMYWNCGNFRRWIVDPIWFPVTRDTNSPKSNNSIFQRSLTSFIFTLASSRATRGIVQFAWFQCYHIAESVAHFWSHLERVVYLNVISFDRSIIQCMTGLQATLT